MITYVNGNRLIAINPLTGEKRRYKKYNENKKYIPYRPESLDVNLSYKCNLGCPFCYLGATKKGKEFTFDKDFLDSIFNFDISGMEIALNFNDGQDYEMTKKVISYFKNKNAIPNVTVNYKTFYKNPIEVISLNPYHFGVSIESYRDWEKFETDVVNNFPELEGRIVYHIINGVFPKKDLEKVVGSRVLILGYKILGRGEKYFERINEYFTMSDIQMLLKNGNTVAFDNLAIEQIGVEIDDIHYLGDDGEISFYIDLVKKEFGISSTDTKRFPINSKNVIEMFKLIREIK